MRDRGLMAVLGAGVLACACGVAGAGDFADVVIEYRPAPGQFINGVPSSESLTFNDPSAAVGPPTGGGVVSPDNTKLVSLGGFGGSITLGFTERVMDDAGNPMGLDAIVYGNAFWLGGNGESRWAEAGVIEISVDANGNGLADDAWYVIPGSDIDAGDPMSAFATQLWDDDAGTATPPADVGWYPDGALYPGLGSSYVTGTYALPAVFDGLVLNNAGSPEPGVVERYWGYADVSPTLVLGDLDGDGLVDDESLDAGSFYTVPDDPFTVGVDAGSGGGDAFDIAWAVDPMTGEPAGLEGFDFIRISTGSRGVAGVFGEKSVEIGGVADVRSLGGDDPMDGGPLDVAGFYVEAEPAVLVGPAADARRVDRASAALGGRR